MPGPPSRSDQWTRPCRLRLAHAGTLGHVHVYLSGAAYRQMQSGLSTTMGPSITTSSRVQATPISLKPSTSSTTPSSMAVRSSSEGGAFWSIRSAST